MCTPRLRIDRTSTARSAAAGTVTTDGPVGLFPRHALLERASPAPPAPARTRVDAADVRHREACASGPWHGSPVHSGLVAAVVTVALLASVCGVVAAVRDRPPGRVTLAVATLAAVLTLVQSVLAGIDLAEGSRPQETATYIGYLVGIVVVLPLAVAWSVAERTRWSGVVVAVGGFTVAIMTARLVMLARGTGA